MSWGVNVALGRYIPLDSMIRETFQKIRSDLLLLFWEVLQVLCCVSRSEHTRLQQKTDFFSVKSCYYLEDKIPVDVYTWLIGPWCSFKSPKDRVVGPLPFMAFLWLINEG